MPFLFPAAKVAIAELITAGARHRHVLMYPDYAVLEADDRSRELERRARRVRTLNRLVDERAPLVIEKLLVVLDRYSARELVWIPARRAVESEDLAGIRVDCDRPTLKGVCEDSNHELLEIEIDVRVKRRSAFRVEIGP